MVFICSSFTYNLFSQHLSGLTRKLFCSLHVDHSSERPASPGGTVGDDSGEVREKALVDGQESTRIRWHDMDFS